MFMSTFHSVRVWTKLPRGPHGVGIAMYCWQLPCGAGVDMAGHGTWYVHVEQTNDGQYRLQAGKPGAPAGYIGPPFPTPEAACAYAAFMEATGTPVEVGK